MRENKPTVNGKVMSYDQRMTIAEVPKEELGDSLGDCDLDVNLIRVATSLPLDKRYQVCGHEIGHTWIQHLGLDPLLEDRICDAIGGGMNSMMRFSPGFVMGWVQAYLMEDG